MNNALILSDPSIMNLFIDESVDRQIVERLRQDGHEAL